MTSLSVLQPSMQSSLIALQAIIFKHKAVCTCTVVTTQPGHAHCAMFHTRCCELASSDVNLVIIRNN